MKQDLATLERLIIAEEDFNLAAIFAKVILERGMHGRSGEQPVLVGLTTALIVSYWRPFSRNRGQNGKPAEALDPSEAGFSPEELKLHKRIGELRDQEFAHSDSERHSVRLDIEDSELGKWVSCCKKVRHFPLPREQTEMLAGMVCKMRAWVAREEQRIRRQVCGPGPEGR